ncbi:AAC(3) family N-acetyltransferase [Kitasatospora aureofaciens]|uniref:aminoglycoside N(3)-acetyltransferase n=1 Tax=Kitasatospora aureofaciens TaxID=1894 RepID=UPI001C47F018|nr:AAC(3) family N-acetyltransferase [Kitasatospora aureofaciens]MBV6698062.1 AAC(3) family N-acetyltransferase [Kitasatospora aureofaciens]
MGTHDSTPLTTDQLTTARLTEAWRAMGVHEGMALMVHSSLSSLGPVEGGAAAVVASLRAAVGPTGTVAVPAFTTSIVCDPHPEHTGVPTPGVAERRAAVPLFHPGMPSPMGAIAEALRTLPESRRSPHPQASVAAVGAQAERITARQSLGDAVGRESPFGVLHDLDASVLLIGVGHNRNTFLHYAESLTPDPRLKLRRFPMAVAGERVWIETTDVGNDNDTHFPPVGREFEEQASIREVLVGSAPCRLLPVRALIPFAVRRFTELLAADGAGV